MAFVAAPAAPKSGSAIVDQSTQGLMPEVDSPPHPVLIINAAAIAAPASAGSTQDAIGFATAG